MKYSATPTDIHLMHYLLDCINIKANLDRPTLKKYHEDALAIFEKKSYSHIDAQDENGNTFLHFAPSAVWARALLEHGANPSIKNNEGRQSLRIHVDYSDIKINMQFNENTKIFSPRFKEILFQNGLLQGSSHIYLWKLDNFRKREKYLKDINLYTTKNRIDLLCEANPMHHDDKITSFMNHFDDTRENNSYFLRKIIGTPSYHQIFKSEKMDDLLERHFIYNEHFKVVFKCLDLSPEEDYEEMRLRKILKLMIREKFDFQHKIWGPTLEEENTNYPTARKIWGPTLEEEITNYPTARKIYLQEKLQSTLLIKKENKIHKI